MENGNFAAAIECLSEAISINPHNCNIFLARASCYKSIQMFAEAYFDYSFLIKLEPLNG
jgi:Flp pilus assembly protein TadD